MKKKVLMGLGIVILIAVLVVCAPLLYMLCSIALKEGPARPQIKQGEFDYTLVYSVSGEETRADGTLVFEYDGVSRQLDGVSNKWKSYIKGTKETRILVSEAETGKVYLVLPADARYYMGDPAFELAGLEPDQNPWFMLENNALTSSLEDEERALAGFEIVEWQIEGPIENVYE